MDHILDYPEGPPVSKEADKQPVAKTKKKVAEKIREIEVFKSLFTFSQETKVRIFSSKSSNWNSIRFDEFIFKSVLEKKYEINKSLKNVKVSDFSN